MCSWKPFYKSALNQEADSDQNQLTFPASPKARNSRSAHADGACILQVFMFCEHEYVEEPVSAIAPLSILHIPGTRNERECHSEGGCDRSWRFPDFRADAAQTKEQVQWSALKKKIYFNEKIKMPKSHAQSKDKTSKTRNKGGLTIYRLGEWMVPETLPNMEHRQPIGEQNLDSLISAKAPGRILLAHPN